jgi:hypothetical protein
MKFFESNCLIAAPAAKIWSVLTDPKQLVAGGLGVIRLEGTIESGARIKLWSEVSPDRAFRLRVTQLHKPSIMVWSGGMPLGLLKGERTFRLSSAQVGTEFHMREEYTGPMLPLVWKSIPDLNPSFAIFAAGLKRLAEA